MPIYNNSLMVFQVLWLYVIDDCDISVSEEASCVINNILDLDRQWNFIEQILNVSTKTIMYP